MSATPYASFRFNGEVVNLDERRFVQAVYDGRACGCRSCLACRALEYWRDNAPRGPALALATY